MKIPKKVGTTNKVPKIYQGVRFPHGELSLSLRMPTVGVMTPSANYPDKTAAAAVPSSRLTTLIK